MSNKPFLWRFILCAILFLTCFYFVWQSIDWYRVSDDAKRKMYTPKEYESKYAKAIKLGLDLQGGIYLVLGADLTDVKPEEKKDIIDRIITVIRSRIDEFGVTEPTIKKEGTDKILVELPGMKDPERAIRIVSQTAFLEFKLVDENNQQRISLFLDDDGKVKPDIPLPPNTEILFEESVNPDTGRKENVAYILRKTTLLTGDELHSAKIDFNEFNASVVSIRFKQKGARVFARITEENIGKRIAIILNNKVMSAPVVRERIPDGRAIISGNFSIQEAQDLALVLRAGALPAPVQILENQTVGPSLGRDSINRGAKALILGMILVFLIMIVFYRYAGVIVNLSIFFDIVVILGIMSLFNFTLTFPGVAGLVLTIGMAVDANILIFERIREEQDKGNNIITSVRRGFGKAFLTILDANVTTLIAASILFQFGTGPIKGFAITLIVGIITSMLGSLVFTRMCYEYLLGTVKIKKLTI